MSDAEESGWKRRVSKRFAEVEDELRQGDTLVSLMAEQWRGMTGMAGMFQVCAPPSRMLWLR